MRCHCITLLWKLLNLRFLHLENLILLIPTFACPVLQICCVACCCLLLHHWINACACKLD